MSNLAELLVAYPETPAEVIREAYLLGVAAGRELEADAIRRRIALALTTGEPLLGTFVLSDPYATAINSREAVSD
jgi:hypothetical protein